jgi:hypothetical protein
MQDDFKAGGWLRWLKQKASKAITGGQVTRNFYGEATRQ